MTSAAALRTAYAAILRMVRRLPLRGKWWVLGAAPAIALFGIFFASHSLSGFYNSSLWEAYERKIADPLLNMADHYSPESHQAKLSYRLTMPVIAHFLHLNRVGVLAWLFLSGLFFIGGVLHFAMRYSRDRATAIFAALFSVSTVAGMMCYSPFFSHLDGLALTFLLYGMIFRQPWAVALMAFLAAWSDERGLIASGFLVVFHALESYGRRNLTATGWNLLPQVRAFFSPACLAIYGVWLAYFAGRFYLGKVYGLDTPGTELSLLGHAKQIYHLAFWVAQEGGWIWCLLALLTLLRTRRWLFVLALGCVTAVAFAVAFLVEDVSRSLTYTFPLSFIALAVISRVENRAALRRVVFAAFLFSFLASNYHIWTGGEKKVHWIYPLPVRWVFSLADAYL